MPKTKEKKKVFVAMSGGVDSAIAAALLKKQGYDVYGVFIKGWYPAGVTCTWREDRRDAMRIAAILDIPFYTFDFKNEYKKYVIDYMIKEYAAGRTPNPDIMCNKYIKFDSFLKKSMKMGADKIATGHYVRLETPFPSGNPVSRLFIARDKDKDQSYFLWTLKQKQIKYCLFPIGGYLKEEVRKLAKKFKLPVAEKPGSSGLCFVGEFKMEEFLKNYIKPKLGDILNEKGETVGKHNGVGYYTIGQRRGIGVKGANTPYYVISKNIRKNILTVAKNFEEKKFYKKEIKIKETSWISGRAPDQLKNYSARIRYRQPLQDCKIKNLKLKIKNSKNYFVIFDKPQRAAAAGQSLVLYDKEIMLGGGIIQ